MCWQLFIYLAILTCLTSQSNFSEELSRVKWLCGNEKCTDPISLGHSVKSHHGDDPLKVNFNAGDEVLIFGKPNGTIKYWLVQAGNKKGVAPVSFLKETKIIINKANLIEAAFDFGIIVSPAEKKKNSFPKDIKPSPANRVVDGTTISYDDEEETIEIEDEAGGDIYEEISKSSEKDTSATFINQHSFSESIEIKKYNKENKNQEKSDIGTGSLNVKKGEKLNDFENNSDVNPSKPEVTDQNELLSTNSIKLQEGLVVLENKSDGNISPPQQSKLLSESGDKLQEDPIALESRSDENISSLEVTEQHKLVSGNSDKLERNLITSKNKGEGNIFTSEVTEQNKLVNESSDVQKVEGFKVLEKNSQTNTSPHVKRTEKGELLPNFVEEVQTHINETDKNVLNSLSIENEKEISNPSVTLPAKTLPVTQQTHPMIPDPGLLMTSSPLTDIENLSSDKPSSEATKFLSEAKEVTTPGNLNENAFSAINGSEINKDPIPLDPKLKISPTTDNFNFEFKTESVPTHSAPSEPSPRFNSLPTPYDSEIGKDDSYQSDTSSSESNKNFLPMTKDTHTGPNLDKPPFKEYEIDNHEIKLISPKAEELSSADKEQENNDFKAESNIGDQNQDENVRNTTPDPNFDKTEQAENIVEEGGNWFSSFSAVMDSIKEMFSKSVSGVDEKHSDVESNLEVVSTTLEGRVLHEETGNTFFCEKESDCQSKDIPVSSVQQDVKGDYVISEMFEGFYGESQISWSTIWCLVITSVVVLLFSLGHYYLENLKQEAALISKINTISAELFFAQKELSSIEEQYQQANETYQKLVSETSNNEVAIAEMRKELEESKVSRKNLEDEIKRLEEEVESLIEEGDEMHRMLAESFSEEERTKSLLANISDLKGVLSERLKEIVSLTEQLDNEKQEVELLTISLKKSEEQREATEDKLTKVMNDVDSRTLTVTKEFEDKILMLERIVEERNLERTNLEKEICELQGACETLSVEKELAEKELKKAHGVNSGKALSEWLDTKQIRKDGLVLQKEVEKLNRALEESKRHGALLGEKEKELLIEIESLNNKYESAEKDKIEALTKLQVLSNYFKEKEIQLQEELGTKEAQWLQKQSEDHTIYEQMRSLREENLSYKAQNEALKKEILDQEASFKIQIANEDQKAQENWINLRHTERRLKEVQMEAAHLRSRLTALEANSDSLEEKHKSLEMVNGDVSMGAASPPFMLYPPPDFIPPPPLVSPTRPPPLGRLSSPPLTPPAPLSPFEFYPPPPPSPPPPLRVHKPQPREPHRKQKDSQSSNHSSESLEKPVRRGKR